MANSSIEIEIVADFKDNATGKVKALNAELDKLEKEMLMLILQQQTEPQKLWKA